MEKWKIELLGKHPKTRDANMGHIFFTATVTVFKKLVQSKIRRVSCVLGYSKENISNFD